MANTTEQDRWAEIEVQTNVLMEQIAHNDIEELSTLLTRRQEELELFFQELDYSDAQLTDVEIKIERLLMQNDALIEKCCNQQQSILDEQKQMNLSKQAISAYESESANAES